MQFDVRPDICVSGTSPESVSRLLSELAQYGTHYLRLSRFTLSGGSQKGLVFQVALFPHITDLGSVFHIIQISPCMCVIGVHRRSTALSALLPSVCVEHATLSKSPNHRLSLPQTGPSAQV